MHMHKFIVYGIMHIYIYIQEYVYQVHVLILDRIHLIDCLPNVWMLDGRIVTCKSALYVHVPKFLITLGTDLLLDI